MLNVVSKFASHMPQDTTTHKITYSSRGSSGEAGAGGQQASSWQHKLEKEISKLNAATTLPTYRQSRLEGLAQAKSFREGLGEMASVDIKGFQKLEPGLCVLVNIANKWVIGRILTLWRICARSYPSYYPLEILHIGNVRLTVLQPKQNLG